MRSGKKIIFFLVAAISVILVITLMKSSSIYDENIPETACPKKLNEVLTNEIAANPGMHSLDSAMNSYLKANHIHGLSLAIVRNDSLLFAKGYGEADKSVPVEPGTLFRLASVSKLITATGIMALVDRGRLSLNETVLGPHGILYKYPVCDPEYEKITVEDLLRHEGGFRYAVDDPLFSTRKQIIKNGWSVAPDADMLINAALKERLPVRHGTEAHYSNLGYLLLSRIIEARTGESYDSWMQRNVLNPAGYFMCHAGMGVDCSQFLSKPYILDFDMAFLGIGRFTRQPNETLIEITAAAYEEYYRNPYHYLHLGHNYIVPCQKDGKYYLSFSEDESIMDLPAEELSQRIDAVGAWIQAQKVPPLAIVINRSRYSNWLPQKYFPALEEEILQKLGAVMPVQIKYRPAI